MRRNRLDFFICYCHITSEQRIASLKKDNILKKYYAVKISASPFVIKTVCSKCALGEPSSVRTV